MKSPSKLERIAFAFSPIAILVGLLAIGAVAMSYFKDRRFAREVLIAADIVRACDDFVKIECAAARVTAVYGPWVSLRDIEFADLCKSRSLNPTAPSQEFTDRCEYIEAEMGIRKQKVAEVLRASRIEMPSVRKAPSSAEGDKS